MLVGIRFSRCIVGHTFYCLWCFCLYVNDRTRAKEFTWCRHNYSSCNDLSHCDKGDGRSVENDTDRLAGSSYALGSTRTETAYKIFFRQVLPGFATTVLLAFGRALAMRPVRLYRPMCQEVSAVQQPRFPQQYFFNWARPLNQCKIVHSRQQLF